MNHMLEVYAGRPTQVLNLFFAILALVITCGFWFFMDKVGFDNRLFDLSLGFALIAVSLSLGLTAYNFFRHPTLVVKNQQIYLQNFPRGQLQFEKTAIRKVKQSFLGLSPMIEIEIASHGKNIRRIIAVEKKQQSQVLLALST